MFLAHYDCSTYSIRVAEKGVALVQCLLARPHLRHTPLTTLRNGRCEGGLSLVAPRRVVVGSLIFYSQRPCHDFRNYQRPIQESRVLPLLLYLPLPHSPPLVANCSPTTKGELHASTVELQ
jgi:hypothetical protein